MVDDLSDRGASEIGHETASLGLPIFSSMPFRFYCQLFGGGEETILRIKLIKNCPLFNTGSAGPEEATAPVAESLGRVTPCVVVKFVFDPGTF